MVKKFLRRRSDEETVEAARLRKAEEQIDSLDLRVETMYSMLTDIQAQLNNLQRLVHTTFRMDEKNR